MGRWSARPSRRGVRVLAVLTLAASAGGAFAQSPAGAPAEAPDPDRTFTDFRLRTQAEDGERLSDETLADPLSSDALEAAPPESAPARPAEAAAPEEAPDIDDFDIFDGPEREDTRSRPLLRRAEPIGAQGADGGEAGEPAPAEAFPTTGPVRSPTFAPALAEERLNRTLAGLRPSFPALEDDPFAANGIRVGRFLLYPVLEQDVGVSDNLDEDASEEPGAFSQTTLSARFLSDWARHEADINASAGYRRNFGGNLREDPELGIDARLRLDLASETTAILRGALSFAREDPILADPLQPPSDRPDVLAYSLGAEVDRPFGRARLSATSDIVREERRLGGAFSELSGVDDFSTASIGLRAGYDVGPVLQPFVAGSLGRRFFDEPAPGTQAERDSLISALRGGLAFDFGEKLSGEFALGYAWNRPDAVGVDTLGAPTLDASLNWSPRRGTDVILSAATFFDPEASSLSTSTVYETALALRHRASARTDVTGRLSAALRERDGPGAGDDATLAAEAGLTYWLNRGLALTALARHERLVSDFADAEYEANSIRVGIRLQR